VSPVTQRRGKQLMDMVPRQRAQVMEGQGVSIQGLEHPQE